MGIILILTNKVDFEMKGITRDKTGNLIVHNSLGRQQSNVCMHLIAEHTNTLKIFTELEGE
jgi:hypothetical protein